MRRKPDMSRNSVKLSTGGGAKMTWKRKAAGIAIVGIILQQLRVFGIVHEFGHMIASWIMFQGAGLIDWTTMWTTTSAAFVTVSGAGGVILFTLILTAVFVRHDSPYLCAAPAVALSEYLYFFGSVDYQVIAATFDPPRAWLLIFSFAALVMITAQVAMIALIHRGVTERPQSTKEIMLAQYRAMGE
jgi:hypothetical protein